MVGTNARAPLQARPLAPRCPPLSQRERLSVARLRPGGRVSSDLRRWLVLPFAQVDDLTQQPIFRPNPLLPLSGIPVPTAPAPAIARPQGSALARHGARPFAHCRKQVV